MKPAGETRGQRFRKLLWRALRLVCPVCGKGKLFRNWIQMNSHCPHCELGFEREPGFFLGSVYINYGLTAFVVAIVYPILLFRRVAANQTLLIGALAFVILFPLFFFRYARSLWVGFDQFWDPRDTPSGEKESL